MEKGIYKIEYDKGKIGNGFFCSIPDKNSNIIKALIINTHYLKESDNLGKIKLIIKEQLKEILIDKSRINYINKEYGINIIEIKDIDDINKELFLELDETNINDIQSIYLLYYSEEKKTIVKIDGSINKIYENNYIF